MSRQVAKRGRDYHSNLVPLLFYPIRQGLLSEEELAHLEQASAVATEVTSSIMRLKLEVEEKKRAITLLHTALVSNQSLILGQDFTSILVRQYYKVLWEGA